MSALSGDQPITVAILAVGGQGGGVLSGWLLQIAEQHGWRVQTTSVPGVAQRTGATVYYLELLPEARGDAVLALMPGPAAVDIVVAAELMEAGRAIQRGLVSPDRTTMIASSHRSYATLEKIVPGDGRGDADAVIASATEMSKKFLHADMAAIADRHGSVISASMFGAIAASGVLPFERNAYEDTIKTSKVGVEASLSAFADAFDAIAGTGSADADNGGPGNGALAGGAPGERAQYARDRARIAESFPAEAQSTVSAGLDAVVDFQDARYGTEYLDRLQQLADAAPDSSNDYAHYVSSAARYLAQAMVYDDVIRVADLKTRAGRFARVRDDVKAAPDEVLHVTEFMHPRFEELCATMPAGIGRWLQRSSLAENICGRLLGKGKRVRTDSLRWFVVLYLTAGLRRWRRGSLRHSFEQDRLQTWLDIVKQTAANDVALAAEVLRCQRLVKGYSDTHDRGMGKFSKVLATLPQLEGRPDAATRLAALIEAALSEESDASLQREIESLEVQAAKAA